MGMSPAGSGRGRGGSGAGDHHPDQGRADCPDWLEPCRGRLFLELPAVGVREIGQAGLLGGGPPGSGMIDVCAVAVGGTNGTAVAAGVEAVIGLMAGYGANNGA